MKVTINTDKLKAMLSTVVKGVGNGKLIPITEYLKVELTGNVLSITATNLNNYITVSENGVEGEPGQFLVLASNFVKLVSKTTKNDIEFTVLNTELKIKGNGNYTLPILNEEFPQYDFDMDKEEYTYELVNTKALKTVLAINKYAVATDMVMPCLTGYLVGDKCITTDGIKMCINETSIYPTNLLIPSSLVDLINTIQEEKVAIYHISNKLLFVTENITIYGTELSGKESYPDITRILEREYPYTISVPKTSILSVLDRLAIFTNPYDNNGIRFTFKTNCLEITDLKGTNVEAINYNEPQEIEDFTVTVNIHYITDLIQAVQDINVNLYFGDEGTLKIKDNHVTELLGLMNTEGDN